ncbi:MAG: IS200/IS605 family element transposase accessory protein TnpB [Gammaproteobacteria bacterium]|nr:MAG: IS200/IS605 family element transposase accessory protein TnpB [Gammaproteobacteria bacterium]
MSAAPSPTISDAPAKVGDPTQTVLVARTLRMKVKREAYRWLNAAATEVNFVWNWSNETSAKAARPFAGKPRWLSEFDLNNLSSGASEYFERIGADTIQCVNREYAAKRRAVRRTRLRWRVSGGARRSLGWVPFKAASLRRRGQAVRFCGKSFRIFEPERLQGVKWRQGCFAQDAVGDWWLCLPVKVKADTTVAPKEAVGIDLGLKEVAVTSDGARCERGGFYRDIEPRIAQAQRRGHRRQAKLLHRRAANRRRDALHKFSRRIVNEYQYIAVGDVSSPRLVKTRMAKAVLDSGWGMLRQMLQYKGEHAGRSVVIVNERFTTRACSSCGCLSGPSGPRQLVVRRWCCSACGVEHDRDVNAARNILAGSRLQTSVSGNESSP